MQCIKAIDYDFVRPPIIFRCNGLEFKTACGYKSSRPKLLMNYRQFVTNPP